jgi:hypothetical protein
MNGVFSFGLASRFRWYDTHGLTSTHTQTFSFPSEHKHCGLSEISITVP